MPRKPKLTPSEDIQMAASLDEPISVPTEMVVKKKRGRKPKDDQSKNSVQENISQEISGDDNSANQSEEINDDNGEIMQVKEPKKRGRKPKPKDPKDNEPKEAKKRGRKPKDKVYTVNAEPVAPKFNFADENIILHIPIQEEDLVEHQTFGDTDFLEYNPNLSDPMPFDSFDDGLAPLKNNNILGEMTEPFERIEESQDGDVSQKSDDNSKILPNIQSIPSIHFSSNTNENPKNCQNISGDEPIQKEFSESPRVTKRKMHNIMYEFIDRKQKDFWPERTDVFCYWCCHGFNTRPLGMPAKFKNGKFLLTRNYCSWNCMIAHLFQLKEYDMYEKYQLINFMYSKIYECGPVKIRPSPAREVLKIFGGILTIEEFRESSILFNKKYEVMYPPLTSMIPQVEECTMEVASNKKKDKNYVPVDQNLLDRVQKTLKLKREKPLVNAKHTLESYMDIKVV